MITNKNLEEYKSQSIDDVDVEELKDITKIHVNSESPVLERVIAFMMQIGNPYLFKVGETPVKVSFTDSAPTLQKSLENILTKNNR